MKRSTIFLALFMLVFQSNCREQNSRWETAQEESSGVAVSETALPGSTFNKFFPQQNKEIDIVFKQEKAGFAQASLLRSGKTIAMLSISDTRNNPDAQNKYEGVTEKIAGSPAIVTENSTSILVADRFQVQVQSEGDILPSADRAKWLGMFDLGGLANAF